SEIVPQVVFCAAHVVLVQPHTSGVPGLPPPQVFGAVQSAFDMHPHCPSALHRMGFVMVPPHFTPGVMGFEGTPAVQTSLVQGLPSTSGLLLSATMCVPPAPSHTTS